MMMSKEKVIKLRQKRLNKKLIYLLVINIIIILVLVCSSLGMVNEDDTKDTKVIKCNLDDYNIVYVPDDSIEYMYDKIEYSKDWDGEDDYLLAKIAMTEAEGESLKTKVLVILTVLNRVHSEEFPNSINDVIFQENNGIYQFTPVEEGGSWWNTEPNEECYEAVEIVKRLQYDFSNGALYFEACADGSWHKDNLEFICQYDNTRFYK